MSRASKEFNRGNAPPLRARIQANLFQKRNFLLISAPEFCQISDFRMLSFQGHDTLHFEACGIAQRGFHYGGGSVKKKKNPQPPVLGGPRTQPAALSFAGQRGWPAEDAGVRAGPAFLVCVPT